MFVFLMASTVNVLSKLDRFIDDDRMKKKPLSDDALKCRDKCEESFYFFVKQMWRYSGASADFLPNWHIQALCDHLQACYEGRISYLIINIPPRAGRVLYAQYCL